MGGGGGGSIVTGNQSYIVEGGNVLSLDGFVILERPCNQVRQWVGGRVQGG